MQTFLPVRGYYNSGNLLDYRRLGKQRVEAWQILRALRGETKGWQNHPATKMWEGHEYDLCMYGWSICDAWRHRGYKDTMRVRFIDALKDYEDTGPPPWLGDEEFHLAHQSNLIRKDPEFYSPLFPGVPDDIDYIWPV